MADKKLNDSDMKKVIASKIGSSEEEIDSLVESQADNDDAWEEPIQIRRKQEGSLHLPADLMTQFMGEKHNAKKS